LEEQIEFALVERLLFGAKGLRKIGQAAGTVPPDGDCFVE
jgi:hypothetical protein